jgi:hypothetical protein
VSIAGPTDAASLARSLSVSETDAQTALVDLEGQGVVLRGHFTGQPHLEFCDRSLLARIHRYTLNRLRAEIEPVSVADFTRFLFAWQHVDASSQLTGAEGLRAVVARLDGFELPVRAWERAVLPARLDRYETPMLDMLCLAGQAGWSRLSPLSPDGSGGRSLRLALYLREHAAAWHTLRFPDAAAQRRRTSRDLDDASRRMLTMLRSSGASFLRDLSRAAGVDADALTAAIATLAARGLVTSDGFAGVRALVRAMKQQPVPFDHKRDLTGRWSALDTAPQITRDAALDVYARVLLERYGGCSAVADARDECTELAELTRTRRSRSRDSRRALRRWHERRAIRAVRCRVVHARNPPAGRQGRSGFVERCGSAEPHRHPRGRRSRPRSHVHADRVSRRRRARGARGRLPAPLGQVESTLVADVASAAAGRRMPAVSSGFVGR